MARPSAIKPEQIESAIRDYLGSSNLAVTAIADRHGVPATTLRREIRKRGIVRTSAPEQKRRRVEEHFAGGLADTGQIPRQTDRTVEEEAERDIEDMEDALSVARACIKRLLAIIEGLADPRDIKTVAEANKLAMESIRRIRGLDAQVDLSKLSDAELEAIASGKRLQ